VTADFVRKHCLSLPGAAENIQWDHHLVFKVSSKIFAITALEPARHWLSFKCDPEEFAELVERPGIVPAPYLARARWAALESRRALARPELERLLTRSYELVVAGLPKKNRPLRQPSVGSLAAR